MGSAILLWLLATFVCRSAVAADYQECKAPPPLPREADEKLVSRGVNETQRAFVVHLHNAARERVASGKEQRGKPGPQPTAANMNALAWDDELASRAQNWADRREFQHNPCRSSKNYSVIGENLAIQMSVGAEPSDFGWPKAVGEWYEEVTQWSSEWVPSYKFKSGTGHYTQVVWAETTRVGCGSTSYDKGPMRTTLFVCNYYPAGNFVKEPVYKKGAPHSECPRDRRKRRQQQYPSLCSA